MLTALLLVTTALPQDGTVRADVEPTSLFDGETLAGWSGDPRFWSVEDGAIVGRSTAEVPCEATTYLVLEDQEFGDFDLSVEYRIDGGNSGVQFRSRVAGDWKLAGHQADLEDGPNWTGGIYEQGGRGVMVRRGEQLVTDGTSDERTALEADVDLDALGGPREWHTYRVRAVGERIELFVDGVLTARLVDTAPVASRSGVLGLQMHQGPPMEVRYRNVRIRRLGVTPRETPAGRSGGRPDAPIAAEALELPPGFAAETLYTVPRGQGSWVALTVDRRGRIIAAAEAQHGLFRLTLEDGRVASVEPLGIDIAGAQGLLAHGPYLYVMRNEWQSGQNGLWRARDTDGDDTYDELELLESLDGGGEHGPHAIRLTPDGTRLQVIAGNATRIPADIARSHVLMRWCEDQVLPSLPDTFGHGSAMHLHGGWTATCDLDGNDWELVAVGMRNAYDFAYDEHGEALTYDSDMEWDMGLPWYRAPRVVHLFRGAEFGWRRGSGKLPDDAPETLGAICETGPASPVGVLHGRNGAFHPPFDDRLFIGDWTRGRVLAVELTPGRGSYTGEVKPFVGGRPFPVTDMEWLPDGSMVIAIGGRGGRSALYRVASTVERDAVTQKEPASRGSSEDGRLSSIIALDFIQRTRRMSVAPSSAGDAPWAAEETWLAYARAAGKEHQDDLFTVLLGLDGPLDRLRLRAIELSVARDGDPSPEVAERVAARLAGELPKADPRWNAAAVELLVRFRSPAAQAWAVPAMENAETQEQAIDLALALSWAETGWSDDLARRYLDFLHTDARAFRGGRSVAGYVDRIRAAALERAGPAVEGGYEPPEPASAAPRPIEATFFVKAWGESDLAPLLDRLPEEPDLAAGELAFRRARCFTCHRVGDEGEGTGPDLTDAGARFTPRDLLTSLLEPSKDVSGQYRDTEIWTTDGAVFTGRRVEAEDGRVAVQEANAGDVDGPIVAVLEDEVRLMRPSRLSRMPRGLLDVLTEEEIVDLLAWVLEDKRADAD